ncbi:MAG: carboxypeptidase regulatory-like domain-containing protein [Armatimonadota bacterium]
MSSVRMLLRAFAAFVLVSGCPAAHSAVLWKSDFVNKGIEQFDIYDVGPQMNPEFTASSGPSKWYVSNGALHQDSNIYGKPDPPNGMENPYTGTTAVVKDFSAQDGIFFVQFRTGDDDGISLVFRWQDEKNFMRFVSLRDPGNGGPVTRLEKWTDGNFEILDFTTDVVYQQNVQETMLVVAKGSQVEAYVADLGQPLLKATDSDPKPGRFGVALYAEHPIDINVLEALTPDSNLYVATLRDKDGNPLGGYWTSLSRDGEPVAGIYTNPDGQALFLDVPAGTYQIATGGLTIQPVAPQTATVKAGVSAQSFTLDVKPTETVADLSTSAGAAWKIKIPVSPTDDYRDPAKSDADFLEYEAPSDWDSIESTHPTYAWLRLRVSIPSAYQGKDLVLTGWNLDDQDWTYWNGQFIGHTEVYNIIRTYVVPGSIVKADNVLAIRGLDTGGPGGMTQSAPKLLLANPSVSITGTVTDQNGKPVEGVQVTAFAPNTVWGPQTATATTSADGVYFIGGLAPASYTITRQPRLDLDPAEGQTVTKVGAAGETLTANFTVGVRPKMDLTTAAGIKWKALYPADPGDPKPAGTAYNEAGMVEVTVPGRLEDQGLGDEYSLFWYRAHITLPDSFKAYKGRDLILTGFNIDDADVTYFNGKEIGKTGSLPTDPTDPAGTGYSGNAGGIRTYTIPADLVNWDGDNVLAINGFENTGDSGMTSSGPTLIVAPGPAAPPVVRGDVSGDGKVGVPDATMALRFAVGLDKPSDQQLAAGDVNGNGKIDIPDVTLILRAAVGLAKL